MEDHGRELRKILFTQETNTTYADPTPDIPSEKAWFDLFTDIAKQLKRQADSLEHDDEVCGVSADCGIIVSEEDLL